MAHLPMTRLAETVFLEHPGPVGFELGDGAESCAEDRNLAIGEVGGSGGWGGRGGGFGRHGGWRIVGLLERKCFARIIGGSLCWVLTMVEKFVFEALRMGRWVWWMEVGWERKTNCGM